jgi:hypothetical protein
MSGREKTMESYIVRIYRFEKNNPRHLVGIVESVEGDKRGKRAFTNLDDLWEILNSRMSETFLSQQEGATREVNTPTPANPVEILVRPAMKVIVDARRLSRDDRGLLVEHAIKKVGNGEIVALADDDNTREEISRTARNHGWMLKGIESRGDSYRIIISKRLEGMQTTPISE